MKQVDSWGPFHPDLKKHSFAGPVLQWRLCGQGAPGGKGRRVGMSADKTQRGTEAPGRQTQSEDMWEVVSLLSSEQAEQ